jgi:hypothetical protein
MMFRASPSWSSRFYVGEHSLVEVVKRRAASHRRVRYEDLVADPVGVIEWLRSDLGLSPGCGFEVVDGKAKLPGSHIIDANPSRFDSGDVAIRLDDAWRSEMRPRDRRLVEAMTFPMLGAYGYSSRRRRSTR